MSITEFQAKNEESTHRLRDILSNGLAIYKASEHCRFCQLLQDQDDKKNFVVIEVWDSIEARNASAKNIPTEIVEEAMKLSAWPPHGRNFTAQIER